VTNSDTAENNLSYENTTLLTAVKSFMVQASWLVLKLLKFFSREFLLQGRISTADLLLLTSVDQLLSKLKKYFSSLQNKLF